MMTIPSRIIEYPDRCGYFIAKETLIDQHVLWKLYLVDHLRSTKFDLESKETDISKDVPVESMTDWAEKCIAEVSPYAKTMLRMIANSIWGSSLNIEEETDLEQYEIGEEIPTIDIDFTKALSLEFNKVLGLSDEDEKEE